MNGFADSKKAARYAMLFMFTYMASYLTRYNYGAVISEMVSAEGLTKSALSIGLTGAFITYGIGQIVGGVIGDKLQPKKVVLCGLAVSVCMNLLIPQCANTAQITAVWCVNGFAQAFIWPPMVRIMMNVMCFEDYKRLSVIVSFGGLTGSVIVYLISPLLILLFNWKSVFIFSASFAALTLIFWIKYCPLISDKEPKNANTDNDIRKPKKRKVFDIVFTLIIVTIILQGMLKDGITTWTPSYISETYGIKNELSIFTGMMLPLMGIAACEITSVLYRKKIKDPLKCAGVLFAIGPIALTLLLLTSGNNVVLSVLFCALSVGSMYGVNYLLTCIIPTFYVKTGHVSTVAGLLNSSSYVGSSISSYGMVAIAENNGWTATLTALCVVAIVGTVICFITIVPWNRKMRKT